MTSAGSVSALCRGIVKDLTEGTGPGLSLLVARGEDVLFCQGFGMADVDRGLPVTPRTRFLIGSVTKQFTALSLLLLEEEGLLSLEEPVARFFPGFPSYVEEVTLRQLIHHTSGIREYLTREFWEAASAGSGLSQEELLVHIAGLGDTDFAPGSSWSYCNSGYIMLGAVVEMVSGVSFAEFVDRRILTPVGMAESQVGTRGEYLPGQAVGYWMKEGKIEAVPYTREVVGWADGNLISTVGDLHRWALELRQPRAFSHQLLGRTMVPVKPLDPSFSRYAMGHVIGERRGVREVHHGGSTLGYMAGFSRFTDENLHIIVLSNRDDLDIPALVGRIAEGLLEGSMVSLVPVDLPSQRLEALAGTYIDPLRGEEMKLEVSYDSQEGVLAVRGPGIGAAPVPLTPLSEELFRLTDSRDYYLEFACRAPRARLLRGGIVVNLMRHVSGGGTERC